MLQSATGDDHSSTQSADNELQVELISTRERWEDIEADWRRLTAAHFPDNPFLSFDWTLTWWDCHGKDKQLMIYLLRCANRIIGIVPLMRIRKTFLRRPYYEVYLITATQRPLSPLAFSGSLDFLIPVEHRADCEKFIRFLLTGCKDWHYLRLHPLPENSAVLSAFRRSVPKPRNRLSIMPLFENACLHVGEDSWQAYCERHLSCKFRKNISRAYRRLASRYPLEFIEYRRPEQMDQAIVDIVRIERVAWKALNGYRIDDERMHDFYFRLIRRFSQNGQARIWILKIDGQPAAYDLHIQSGQSIKTLKGSYDAAFAAFSPGVLLSHAALQRFFQEGIRHIDLLWGNLYYKQKWTNALERQYGVYLTRTCLLTLLIDWSEKSGLRKIIRIYRKLRHTLLHHEVSAREDFA